MFKYVIADESKITCVKYSKNDELKRAFKFIAFCYKILTSLF